MLVPISMMIRSMQFKSRLTDISSRLADFKVKQGHCRVLLTRLELKSQLSRPKLT
ncbi:hypothetical protein D3C72_2541240 [compost metagenome]